ncbi:hypothetical protein WMY93_004491 [Mugilogobius chulae]|uniref:Replication termination factor 2 n=1 Tax=Mugilogobius chulae TaxID=88201 RepID=A0AAW0PNN5_9GOBI
MEKALEPEEVCVDREGWASLGFLPDFRQMRKKWMNGAVQKDNWILTELHTVTRARLLLVLDGNKSVRRHFPGCQSGDVSGADKAFACPCCHPDLRSRYVDMIGFAPSVTSLSQSEIRAFFNPNPTYSKKEAATEDSGRPDTEVKLVTRLRVDETLEGSKSSRTVPRPGLHGKLGQDLQTR